MKLLRRLLLVALFAAFAYAGYRFAIANGDATQVDLVLASWEAPRWQVLLASLGLGAGLVGLWSLYQFTRMGLVTRRYRKAVRGLESEIHQLRNLPLAGEEAPGAVASAPPEPQSAAGPSR